MDLGSSMDTGYQRQCAGGAKGEGVVIAPLLASVRHKHPTSSQLVKAFCLLRAEGKGITAVSAGPRKLCRNSLGGYHVMDVACCHCHHGATLQDILTEMKPIIPKHFYCYSTLSSLPPFASFSSSKRDPQNATFLVVFHVRVLLVYSQVFSALWGFRGLEKVMYNCVTRRIYSGQLGKSESSRQES